MLGFAATYSLCQLTELPSEPQAVYQAIIRNVEQKMTTRGTRKQLELPQDASGV